MSVLHVPFRPATQDVSAGKSHVASRVGRTLIRSVFPPLLLTIAIAISAFLLPVSSARALDGVCVMFCDDPPATDDDGGNTGGGYYSTPKGQGWFCEARARDGSWGWGESFNKSNAQSYALSECGKHARACRITTCALGAGRNYDAVKGRWRKKPSTGRNAGGFKPLTPSAGQQRIINSTRRKPLYGCDVCYSKLKADVNAGLGSARLRSYVAQAVAGYNNCKLKSDRQCGRGDGLSRALSTKCILSFGQEDYRVCIGETLRQY